MNIKQNELTAADMAAQTGKLSEQITKPISGSKKIYIEGSRPDIRVPMREIEVSDTCLLYTSPSPRDLSTSRMPSSA